MIRAATATDVPAISQLIRALADYEWHSPRVSWSEDQLRQHLFGPRPYAEILLAEEDNQIVGYVLFFPTYSTVNGRPNLYLEDLFVEPKQRGQGHGRALLDAVAQLAVQRGCDHLEWSVLNWNEPAMGFYRSLGAVPSFESTIFRLAGEALTSAANSAESIMASP